MNWRSPASGDQLELPKLNAHTDARPSRKRWAWLLAHVFRADLDTCVRCGGHMGAFEPELRVLLFTVPTFLRFLSQGLGATLGRFDSASWSLRFESRWLIGCPWAVTTPEPVLAASDGCVGSMLAVR